MTERIVIITTGDDVLSLAVALQMFLVDVVGKHPGRILHLGGDAESTDRSLPVEPAEPHREGVNNLGRRASGHGMMLVRMGLRYGGRSGVRVFVRRSRRF